MIETNVVGQFNALAQRLRAMGKQANYACAVALTRTGQDAARAVNDDLPRYLDSPTAFTRAAFTVRRANKENLRAVVFAKDAQAKYLRYQVAGGSRAPNRKALRLPSEIKLNEFGNIPRGEIAKLIAIARSNKRMTRAGALGHVKRMQRLGISAALNLFYGDPGNGKPPGIYKRVEQGDRRILVPLIVFPATSAHYKPRLPLKAIVDRVAKARFPVHFQAAWADAVRTAR